MQKKNTYKTTDVERVDVLDVLARLHAAAMGGVVACLMAFDVAKERFVVALIAAAGETILRIRFRHPTQTEAMLALTRALQEGGVRVSAAMEPTGTYGDAVRWQFGKLGVVVHRVSPKKTHDARELLDGVPSLHDGKSTEIIGRLHGMGLSTEWTMASESRRQMRALVETRRMFDRMTRGPYGMLEAHVSRHWPEFGRWMDVWHQKSALRLLQEFGGPSRVSAEPETAKTRLHEWSNARLAPELIDSVVASAKTTLGVPMTENERRQMQHAATIALDGWTSVEAVEREMAKAIEPNSPIAHLEKVVGLYTAVVLGTLVDPIASPHARAFEKACGLNLREKSSGQLESAKKITKRGPSEVRRVLYLAALRFVQTHPAAQAWYARRGGYSDKGRKRALVAVMRKLVKALWYVARGHELDVKKLFDLRRLDLDEAIATSTTCRTKGPEPRRVQRQLRGKRDATTKVDAMRT